MKPILLLLAATAVAFSQAPQLPASDCAADGVVVNSLTGEPIPRARVIVNAGAATSSATADSSGKWNLSNVACGAQSLIVSRFGFLGTASRPLTLLSGSPAHDVKIELTPQSVFYGRVLDDQGDPAMNAQIRVFASRVVDGQITFGEAQGGNTNDLGDYRIPGLRRGKYIVCAYLAGGLAVAETCYPGPVEGGSASAMEVPAGRETRVDFALTPVPGIHIRGTVSGLPAARGAGIRLVKSSGNTTPLGMQGRVNKNTFDIHAAPGSYTLTADYFEAGKHLFARVPVEAGTSDIDNLAVALDSGFTISGTIAIASQSGQAVAKKQFNINLRSSGPIGDETKEAKWDANHSAITFDGMGAGDYRLDVFPPAPFYLKSANLAGQDILKGDFPLSQGSGPIEIVLGDDGGSIEGDVIDADGKPAMGGVMALRNGRAVIAHATGHFKLQNLAPGDYIVYAWDDPAEVAYADTDWMRRYGGNGVEVTVTASQSSQVKLTQQKVPE